MNIDYYLDNWVILETTLNNKVDYVLLGGCSGGYLDGDTWRMNSGIKTVAKAGKRYIVTGKSGSIYSIPIEREGLSMSFAYIFNKLSEDYGDAVKIVKIGEIYDL